MKHSGRLVGGSGTLRKCQQCLPGEEPRASLGGLSRFVVAVTGVSHYVEELERIQSAGRRGGSHRSEFREYEPRSPVASKESVSALYTTGNSLLTSTKNDQVYTENDIRAGSPLSAPVHAFQDTVRRANSQAARVNELGHAAQDREDRSGEIHHATTSVVSAIHVNGSVAALGTQRGQLAGPGARTRCRRSPCRRAGQRDVGTALWLSVRVRWGAMDGAMDECERHSVW
jgi:hypothetical protein